MRLFDKERAERLFEVSRDEIQQEKIFGEKAQSCISLTWHAQRIEFNNGYRDIELEGKVSLGLFAFKHRIIFFDGTEIIQSLNWRNIDVAQYKLVSPKEFPEQKWRTLFEFSGNNISDNKVSLTFIASDNLFHYLQGTSVRIKPHFFEYLKQLDSHEFSGVKSYNPEYPDGATVLPYFEKV